MGWTCYYAYGEKDKKTLMTKELEQYGDVKVLKAAMKGSVYYAACINTKTPNEIWAIVCLTRLDHGEFGYKDMDETMHPYYYNCPKSILDMLTPTTNVQALQWREACRKPKSESTLKKLNKLPIGSIIEVEGEQYIKHEPCYQFKTAFFKAINKFSYIPKNRIRDFVLIQ